ncbi:MAG: Lacal_2735 family protein [Aquaticitalea sp.]
MFGLFKKKSEETKLQESYDSLMKEWHLLSSTNRKESDKKYAEAQEVMAALEALKKQ